MSPVPGSPPDLAPADRGGWDVPRPPTAAGASHEIAAMPQLTIQSSGPHYNREHVILNPAGLVSARLFRVTDDQAEAVRALLAGEAQPAAPQVPEGIAGELVEMGDDEDGNPRLTIATTREKIRAFPGSLLFKPVIVCGVDHD